MKRLAGLLAALLIIPTTWAAPAGAVTYSHSWLCTYSRVLHRPFGHDRLRRPGCPHGAGFGPIVAPAGTAPSVTILSGAR